MSTDSAITHLVVPAQAAPADAPSSDVAPAADDAVTYDQIVAIATDVWTSFLDLDVEECGATPAVEGPTLTGGVSITGAWNGSVFLSCSEQFGRQAAAAMFATDVTAVTEDDVVDALGELANMVGGNIKSVVPAPSDLSLPSVARGHSYTVSVPAATLLHDVGLRCADESFRVAIWQV